MANNQEIIQEFDSYVMGTYGRFPIALASGKGCHCVDEDGKEYIDFGSGIGTNSLGYCDSEWVKAVCEQASNIQHTSNYYYTKVQGDLAAKLCGLTGYSKVFFGNSGAEANECAIKLARKYSFDKYGKGRDKIVTLVNSFHGRTLCTLSATGQEVFHNYFYPFVDGFVNAEANNMADLKAKLDDSVCAVMFEFIQGEGGVIPLAPSFVDELMKVCADRDILTIADEVQTGVGRTGNVLASQGYGVQPNITTLAKGLGGGLPIGVCLADKKCESVLGKSTHGSTFGGNPVVCAGALAVLNRVGESSFLSEVKDKAKYFREKLSSIPEIAGVDGIGLMLGSRLKSKKASDVIAKCVEQGLLILTAKDKLRFLPPLTITYQDIDDGIEILSQILN